MTSFNLNSSHSKYDRGTSTYEFEGWGEAVIQSMTLPYSDESHDANPAWMGSWEGGKLGRGKSGEASGGMET